jgi:four helix bundle suffix protein
MEGYRYLITFQLADFIYQATLRFLETFGKNLSSREKAQMEQAARSGKMNIAEGYSQKTSLKGYIKLLGIAKGSLEELKLDYEDFLKRKGLTLWDKNDPRIRKFREIRVKNTKPFPDLPNFPEEFCNLLITLIYQNTFLLTKQIESLIEKHKKEGGFTEKLYRNRINYLKSK